MFRLHAAAVYCVVLHSISCAVQKDLHPVQSGHGLKDPKCFQVSELYI